MDSSKQNQEQLPVISIADIAKQPQRSGNLSYEDPDIKKHRLEQESADAKHRRWRSTILFVVTLIGISSVFLIGTQILNNPQATVDDKKWATALVTSIVSGGVGYITGKAIA